MGGLFSKSPKSTSKHAGNDAQKYSEAGVTEKDRAILDLKNARDRLKKYRKKVRQLQMRSVILYNTISVYDTII